MIEKEYLFSPSELDYKAKKCPRCFYISKHYKINAGDRPPPVFLVLMLYRNLISKIQTLKVGGPIYPVGL